MQPAEKMRQDVRASSTNSTRRLSGDSVYAPSQRAPPSQVILRLAHYDLLEEIGRGGFAQVYKGVDTRSGTVVAVKMATTGGKPDDERAIRREMDIYERLKLIPNAHLLGPRHLPGGRPIRSSDRVRRRRTLWDLTIGDQPDAPRRPGRSDRERDLLAVLDGLCALHENDIVHRDIKPENILRCDDVWKIADFGISKLRSSPVTGFTMQGAHSLPWAPPEQRDGAVAHPSADIYAIGRVIGFLLSGSVKVEDYAGLPGQWAAIIKPCLAVNPDERPDAQHLRAQVSQLDRPGNRQGKRTRKVGPVFPVISRWEEQARNGAIQERVT